MTLIYLAFIRPFVNFLHNEISHPKNTSDGNYLFNDEVKPDKCWMGQELSDVLSRESIESMGWEGQMNLWKYRHIALGITKRYVKAITLYFGDRDLEQG